MAPTGMQALAADFFRERANRIGDAHLADQVGALGVDQARSVLSRLPEWQESPDGTWTLDGRSHIAVLRYERGRWSGSGELADLAAVGARLGLVPQMAWPSPGATSASQGQSLAAAGWAEIRQMTSLANPCYVKQEGHRRAVAAFSGFNKTFVPAWCGGGDLYLCLHAAMALAA